MNKIQSQNIIDQTMVAFGLYPDLQTNPQIIQGILKEMELDDFTTAFPPMEKFFKEIFISPIPLKNFLDDIAQGIIDKHPAIVEFAEIGIQKGWFVESKYVYRTAQVTFILEHIVAAMCNNHAFFIEIHDHLRQKERNYGLDSKHVFKACKKMMTSSHSYFDTIKAVTIDPYMVYFRIGRGLGKSELDKKEAKNLMRRHKLNYFEYKLLSPAHNKSVSHALELLEINIYEAGITDYKKGSRTNSISAFELTEDILMNPPVPDFIQTSVVPEKTESDFYRTIVSKDNLFPTVSVSQPWASLYTTWNMAFILGTLDDLDILFPKLLIPSLLNAKVENFGSVRFVSLWLCVNTFFFRRCNGVKNVVGPKYKKEMAETWATINKKYAFDLAKRETHEDSQKLMQHYDRTFSSPFYHFFRLFVAFLR